MSIGNQNPRQVVHATLVIACVALAFYTLYFFREILFVLVIALILAMALQPVVRYAAQLSGNRANNVLIIYSVLALISGLLLVGATPLLVRQSSQLLEAIPENYEKLRLALFKSEGELRFLAFELPSIEQLPGLLAGVAGAENDLAEAIASTALTVAKAVIYFVGIFILAAYWSLERNWFIRGVGKWFRAERRRTVEELVEDFERKIGEFIRAQTILCLAVGLLSFIAYLIIGLPYPFALGVLAGLMEAVPIFGPVLAAIPAGLVALPLGTGPVLAVVVAATLIQALENTLLVPRVMNHSVGVHPILTLLSLVTLASLLGIPGGVVAIPFASGVQILFRRFGGVEMRRGQGLEGRDAISALRYEAREVLRTINQPAIDPLGPSSDRGHVLKTELENMVLGLDRYLEQVEDGGGAE